MSLNFKHSIQIFFTYFCILALLNFFTNFSKLPPFPRRPNGKRYKIWPLHFVLPRQRLLLKFPRLADEFKIQLSSLATTIRARPSMFRPNFSAFWHFTWRNFYVCGINFKCEKRWLICFNVECWTFENH